MTHGALYSIFAFEQFLGIQTHNLVLAGGQQEQPVKKMKSACVYWHSQCGCPAGIYSSLSCSKVTENELIKGRIRAGKRVGGRRKEGAR